MLVFSLLIGLAFQITSLPHLAIQSLLALVPQFNAQQSPVIPAVQPNADFPLRVQLQISRTGYNSTPSVGRGNIMGDTQQGFDFIEYCDLNISQNREPQQIYQARWKKKDQKLEILLQEIGKNHLSRCELKTTVQPIPYNLAGGSYSSAALTSVVGANVSDPNFPLKVQLQPTSNYASGAQGRGNIVAPTKTGFDFISTCAHPFAYDQVFPARWKQEGLQLEILVQEIGNPAVLSCGLKVTLRSTPYLIGSSVFSTEPPPTVAANVSNPAYPLRVQLEVIQASSQNGIQYTQGHGNILASTKTGFDFVSTCVPLDLNQLFSAKWKEEGIQLEILMQEISNREATPCELKVTLRGTPYPLSVPASPNPQTSSSSAFSFMDYPHSVPANVSTGAFPLRVKLQVRSTSREQSEWAQQGHANIEAKVKIGLAFTTSCPYRFATDELYPARWKEENLKLEIMLQEIGVGKAVPCELKVAVRPTPYQLSTHP